MENSRLRRREILRRNPAATVAGIKT